MFLGHGYRDFSEYNDYQFFNFQDHLAREHQSGGSSSLHLDSDTDSAEDYSDARSQLGERHALDPRHHKPILYFTDSQPGAGLHQAFEMAAECKVHAVMRRSCIIPALWARYLCQSGLE